MHAYTGKKNIFQPQIMQKEIGSLPLGYLDLIGEDPAAGVRLYGRADVPFVTRGKANPIAAAFFNSDTKRLQIIQNPDPKTLMTRFAARAPRGAVAVGSARIFVGCAEATTGAGARDLVAGVDGPIWRFGSTWRSRCCRWTRSMPAGSPERPQRASNAC
jgi:hypothetical protein